MLAEERVGAGRIEVADVRSEKQRQRPARAGCASRVIRQARLRTALRASTTSDARRARSSARLDRVERGRRDVDRCTSSGRGAMPPGVDQRQRASRRCRGPARRRRQAARRRRRSRGRAALEQAQLGARDAVPRQPADRLEQRRAERVVEVARRQLPRLLRQVVLDVARELRGRRLGAVSAGAVVIVRSRAAERGVDVRIARAEPVAERRPEQLARRRRRCALHHEVLRRRRSRPSTPDTTPSRGTRERARTSCPSTPSRCRRDPRRPTRSRPAGWLPAGSGSQLEKSKTPCARRRLGVAPRMRAARPSGDPYAARWNSASVGRRAPRHRAYAAASAWLT